MRRKYGFGKFFVNLLNGPNPFFVIRTYLLPNLYPGRKEQILREELMNEVGDGFKGLVSFYDLLKIPRLIEQGLIPERARFLDRNWRDSHMIIFCKPCTDSVREVFSVLTREREDFNVRTQEREGSCQWFEVIDFAAHYEALGVPFARFISDSKMPCTLQGHPAHVAGQLDQEVMHPSPPPKLIASGQEQEQQVLTIEALSTGHPNESNFRSNWDSVEEVLQKMYSCKCEEELLNVIENLCTDNMWRHLEQMSCSYSDSQRRIFAQLRHSLGNHLVDVRDALDSDDELFLQKVSEHWDMFYLLASGTVKIFIKVGPSMFTSLQLGLDLWRRNILLPGNLIRVLVARARSEMHMLDADLIQRLSSMIRSFPETFELAFVGHCQDLYQADAAKARALCLESMTSKIVHNCAYLQFAEDVHDDEVKLAKLFFEDAGQLRLMKAFQKHYLTDQIDLLTGCFGKAFDEENFGLLGRIHALLRRFPTGYLEMKRIIASNIMQTVSRVMDGPEPALNGQQLLDTRYRYDRLINETLENDKLLEQFLNISFKNVVNSNSDCTRSMVACIDSKLREAFVLNIDIDMKTEPACMFTVKYLGDNLFLRFYQHYLADRLINQTSSLSVEELVVKQLKAQFGSDSTSKLKQMLRDMKASKQCMDGFSNDVANSIERPEVSFMVLSADSWPVEQQKAFHLPHGLHQVAEQFRSHYLGMEAHKRKKVLLQTHLGSATLKAPFLEHSKDELIVSTSQMSVLMLFNSADSLTYAEIRDSLGMYDAELKGCLQSLLSVHGSPGILILNRCDESGFSEKDILSINEKFNGGPDLSLKHDFESGKLSEAVDEAASHNIDAAIGRIMKSRKSLDHAALIKEVAAELCPRFVTTPAAIKSQIEHLMGDTIELLERDPDDPSRYLYIP